MICVQSREGEVWRYFASGRTEGWGALSKAFKRQLPSRWRRQKARNRLSFCTPILSGDEAPLAQCPCYTAKGVHLLSTPCGREVEVFTSQYRYINAAHGMNCLGPNSATITDTGTASEINLWFCRYLQDHLTFFLWIVSLSETGHLWIFVEIRPILVLLTTKVIGSIEIGVYARNYNQRVLKLVRRLSLTTQGFKSGLNSTSVMDFTYQSFLTFDSVWLFLPNTTMSSG